MTFSIDGDLRVLGTGPYCSADAGEGAEDAPLVQISKTETVTHNLRPTKSKGQKTFTSAFVRTVLMLWWLAHRARRVGRRCVERHLGDVSVV